MPSAESRRVSSPETEEEVDLSKAIDDAAHSLPLSEGSQVIISQSVRAKALRALRTYHENMTAALRRRQVGRVLGAIRDMALFSARRTLAGSMKADVTPKVVAEVDQALGLPPI